jgi:hypothetical protein
MKLQRLLPIMLLVLMVSVLSCKQGPDKLIVKTWKVTDVTSNANAADSAFMALKDNLMKVEMTFKDNKYTMTSNGNVIESGTYSVTDGKLVVTTEKGMNMDATVTKDNLTLGTPDFTTTLQPK